MVGRMRMALVAACVVLLGAGAAAAQTQKVIKNPAEYDAYIGALNTADALKRGAAMTEFAKAYPASIVRNDALEQAMAAYQQAGDRERLEATATELLQLDPGNLRALTLMTFLERARATAGDTLVLAVLRRHAEDGLRGLSAWNQPDGVSEAEYKKLKGQMTVTFAGALGFAQLQAKEWTKARDAYLRAVKIDAANLQDIYELGVAELEATPLEPDGFWYLAKAIALAGAQQNSGAARSIADYGKARYRKYHGGENGWDDLLARAASQSAPPADLARSITAAPTPAELAVKAVKENDPAALSFADWEYILDHRDASPANKTAAASVWKAIQDKQRNGAARLKIPVTVLAATATTIEAAITDDMIQAGTADLHVIMAKPMTEPPSAGTTIDIIGVLSGYTSRPFLFTMTQGEFDRN
jgi:hypothetical protein